MSIDCKFRLYKGFWKCRRCGWVHDQATETPPHRNCLGKGVGTYLHQLLSRVGLKLKKGCKCKQWITRMNREGPAWCEKNIHSIVEEMRAEARRRKLPFLGYGAKLLIRRAIKLARQEERKGGET